MKIYYESKKQERILTDLRLIKKYYGKASESMANRLSELRVANNLNEIPEVPPPRRHKLTGNYKGYWGVSFSRNSRIILKPVGNFIIDDLTSITEIAIVDLVDYH